MGDERLWRLKNAADFSPKISNAVHRLICCLCADLHRQRFSPLDDFPLSAATVAKWLQLKDETHARGYIEKIEALKIIEKNGLHGCPKSPRTHRYRIRLDEMFKGGENPTFGVEKTPPSKGGIHPPNHISNSFQEEIKTKGRKSSAALPRQETKGNKLAASPEERDRIAALVKKQAAEFLKN